MHIGSPGLAFSPKMGNVSDLLKFDSFNGNTPVTEETESAFGKFWRKPTIWSIEPVNYTANARTQSTLTVFGNNSCTRRYTAISADVILQKIKTARQACEELTFSLRNRAHALLKQVAITRRRLFSLAFWFIRQAVKSGTPSSAEHKRSHFQQKLFRALNDVVNTTYRLVVVEKQKQQAIKMAEEMLRPDFRRGQGLKRRFSSPKWPTLRTHRLATPIEAHIQNRAELSGMLYELRRNRREAVLKFYRTVQSRLTWSKGRRRAWLVNGTLPALIDELHSLDLRGGDFSDEHLYSAQHFLRNFIRLTADRKKLPSGEGYEVLVNRTMTTLYENASSVQDSESDKLKCEFTNYGNWRNK
ncbi:hypothetical protein SprV_0401614100 [Sparganum proliferum]